jgi:hypothetical protein
MAGPIDATLRALLVDALPGLFGGATPAVQLAVTPQELVVDPLSADAAAGLPAPDDRLDRFPLRADSPNGPYTLTQPPYPGPRRVRLLTGAGEPVALRADEVAWDAADARVFSLAPRATRSLEGFSDVQVLYGVTAVFAKLKATQTLAVELRAADAALLARAEALSLAALTLNRQRVVDESGAVYEDGDYAAEVAAGSLRLLRSEREDGLARLHLVAELELKVRRALADDEGRPIRRIATPGRPADPERPVDIRVDVDA